MDTFSLMILKAVLILVIVLVSVLGKKYLIPWIATAVNNSKYKWIADMANIAVKAAEQTMADKLGTDRKTVVVKFLKQLLLAKKISISDEELDSIIEAAVYAMNLAKKV